MSAAQRKTGGGNPPAAHSNITEVHDRIPAAGFKALHHLLHAARQLHQLPALPGDALHGAGILLTRIRSDIDRLAGGAK